MYKVRFHLGAGEHYMHWQIKDGNKIYYFEPYQSNLKLYNCQLINYRKIAEEIFKGENKTVCAWIKCESFVDLGNAIAPNQSILTERLFYNPKKQPFWIDQNNNNVDNKKYLEIVTCGRNLFARK